jgi:malonyl CoA-acyl carrier protein transacylase
MGRELAALFPEMRAALEEADAILAESPTYRERPDPRLTRLIYPYARFAPAEEAMARQALAQTDVAQPALGAVELGCLALLARLGLKPAVVAGHSYGEFVALQAAGAISRRDLLRVSEARGRFIVTATRGQDLGTMAAVSASAASVRDALGDRPDITIANLNAPDQTVISGSKAAIALAVERLADLSATPVPVAAAFHSPLVAPAQDRLAAFLSDMAFERPQIPVYANTTGRAHMQDPAAIRAQMAAHLTAPVDFIGMIETMYADGARVFLEVGPKTVLSSLTRRILGDRPHIAIAMDGAGGGLVSLLHALAALIVQGAPVELAGLFAGRNLTNPPKAVAKKPGLAWQLNGSRAQPPAGTVPTTTPDAAASVPPNPTQARPAQARKEPAMNVYQAPVDLDGRDEPEASGIDRVLADHHRTMKQFLQMQERLMLAYLNGGSAPASERPRPFSTPRAAALPRRIIASPQMMQAPPPAPPPLAKAASPSQPPASTPTGSPGSSGSAAHAKSSDTKSPDPKGLDQKSLLLTIASEKTGYPVDMLDPTLNMEADLGIDSIKRVEILGAFRKAHPPAVAEYLSPRMTAIAKATTLQEVLVRVAAALAEEGAPRPFDDAGPGPCSLLTRYVMRAERELLPEMPTAVPSGQYIIVPDSQGFAEVLARRLAAAGATPRILPPNCLATDDQIVAWLGEARANGPLQGLVALSALDTPADWPNGMETSIKSLFALLRLAAPELSTGRILFASAMGGTFARDALTRDRTATVFPGAGGGVGLMKTLAVEWPAAICKAVDLDPEQPHDAKADALFTELALPFGRHEVGYSGGQRTIFRTVEAPLAPSPLAATPDGSWVVLAVGGARGITAETLRPFAAAGATCVILGRSALPDAESQTTMSLADGDALRAHFLVEARASGTRVTPAQIQAKIAAFLRDREIRANMADFAALGARIDYRICDVNDAAAVGSLLDVIYASYGRVDAVLFGAGLIEDRLVVDKTRDSLARVFDTKVLGAYHLIERLRPDTLKFLALFSSVAGRYGNRGQGDYAAANEVLNRYAWCLQKRYGRSVKVVAANWGAWESTTRGPGMLTPETARQFRARGLRLITPEEGREALWREYVFGPRDEVEVIFGEHPWEAQEAAAAEQDRRHTERATT